MRLLLALAPILLLIACAPEGQPRLHEIVLYGAEDTRLSYFYGEPTRLLLGDSEVSLEDVAGPEDDPLAVSGALSIDGEPYLRERERPLNGAPTTVSTISRSSDLRVAANADTGPVLYYDGRMWFTLLPDARSGIDTRVAPRPRIGGLRDLGELTRAEAAALQAYLEQGGPVVVTVLDEVPAVARTADGVSEYLRTGLYLQRDFSQVAASPQRQREELVWEVIAEGQQAVGFDEPAFFLVEDSATLLNLWNRAHGSQLQAPPTPDASFERETLVALFMGSRPTGGYRLEVTGVSLEGGDVYVDVRFVEPPADAITTQALTSPWSLVRILRGGLEAVWIRRAGTDELLGAARAEF